MILLLDNYDSFVFNLARYCAELGCHTTVVRNDAASVDELLARSPSAIIVSPGPCGPAEAGVSLELIQRSGSIPLLGVCLGHQAIAAACGGRVVRSPEPMHGRSSSVIHDQTRLFRGLPSPLNAARYHSLLVEAESLPAELLVTARTTDGLIMGLAHRTRPLYGVQFHPESVLSTAGHQLLANFLELARVPHGPIPVGDLVTSAINPSDWHRQRPLGQLDDF